MDKLLNSLYKDTLKELENHNLHILDENLTLFIDLFDEILVQSSDPQKSKYFKDILSYVDSITKKMIQSGFAEKALNQLNQIYQFSKTRNSEKQCFVDFPDTLTQLTQHLKEYRYNQIRQLPVNLLIYHMVVNTSINENGILVDNDLPGRLSGIYNAIRENSALSTDEKKYILDRLVEDILQFNFYNKPAANSLIYKSILHILLTLIRRKDMTMLLSTVEIILARKIHLHPDVNSKIFISLSAYCYYLCFKEDLVLEHQRDFLDILNDLKETLRENLRFYDVGDFWGFYKEVLYELKRWEIPGLNGKWLIMDGVIREYFLFITLVNDIDLIEMDNETFNQEELFTIINAYISNNEVSKEFKSNYSEFVSAFGFHRDIDSDMENLKNQLFLKYKNFLFDHLKIEAQKADIIEKNVKIIEEGIKVVIAENPILKAMKEIEGEKNKLSQNFSFYQSIDFISREDVQNYKSLANTFATELEKYLLNLFINNGFFHQSILFSEGKKIQILLDTIKEQKAINVFISGMTPESTFLYRESNQDKEKYNLMVKKVDIYDETSIRYWLGFNNRDFSIKMSKCTVNLENLSEEEINRKLAETKRSEDTYFLNITNNIFLPFSKSEAVEYLLLNDRRIRIKLEFLLTSNKHPSGFLLDLAVK